VSRATDVDAALAVYRAEWPAADELWLLEAMHELTLDRILVPLRLDKHQELQTAEPKSDGRIEAVGAVRALDPLVQCHGELIHL
jgi:hypothetical protein